MLTLPFAWGWLLRALQLNDNPTLSPYVDGDFLPTYLPFLWAQAVGHLILVIGAYALHRRKIEKSPWLIQIEIHFWAVCLSILMYTAGSFTTPICVMLVGLPVFGYLLFGSALKSGLVTMSVGTVIGMVLPQVGVLPYAPLFKTAPYANGHLHSAWIASFGMPAIFVAVIVVAMQISLLRQLRERQVELEHLSGTDVLTGLNNRAAFFERLEAELSRARRHGQAISIAMLDVDHFKRINDTFGHLAGDTALRQLSTCLRTLLRVDDVAGRYGGEEFALILPHTTLQQALVVGERVRVGVHTIQIGTLTGAVPTLPFSVSIGLAQHDGLETADQLLARADLALYQAKHAGRDQVAVAAAPATVGVIDSATS
jgi:diguanylate cyclase (GGDEF)-like protein